MFEIIFLIFLSGYFIQLVVFTIGVQRKFTRLNDASLPTATIIVAARNEEKNILSCMESLDKQVYPEGKLEIIIVDDRSTDTTGEVISNFIEGRDRFKKIITKEEIGKLKGKTNALANALKIAKGEIILTTDADCTPALTWAKTLASYFKDNIAMVNGFTSQKSADSFSGMQSLDFIFLLAVASGTINLNKPLSCIGNNMAYRKAAYDEVGGYESLPFSVTEDFNLMFAIHRLNKYKIIYPLDVNALVVSKPCDSFKGLFRQKKRWAVGGLKSPPRGYLVMLNGYVTNLSVLLTPVFYSTVWLSLVIFKLLLDFIFLYPVLKKLNLANELRYFPAFQIYYLLYVVALPFIVGTSRKVIWKGREY